MSEVIQLREADGDSNPVCSDSSQLGTEHSLLFLFLIYETFLFFLFFFLPADKHFVSREGFRHQLLSQNIYSEQF